jgi:hypothetical protein
MATKVVTGLFDSHADAAMALEALIARGFDKSDISFIASDEFDHETFGVETHSKLSEGVAIGAGTGGAIGALLAGLTMVGTAATGGLGLVVAGPLVAALAGAGAGAAGGSIIGGLIGVAIPEHEVKHYEDALKEGSVLIGVECEDDDSRKAAKDIFKKYNSNKVSHA